MSGPFHLDLFTLSPVGGRPAALRGGADRGRLYAALAISCLLHAALFFMPYFGASSAAYPPAARGTQEPGPARILDVRLEQSAGPAAEIGGKSAVGAGAASAPRRPMVDEEPRPPRRLSRGIDLLPVPAPTFYSVDQLTKPPRPTSQPMLDVSKKIARSVIGKVILKLWIDELGNVVSVEVEQSNLPALISNSAAAAFGKLRFEPGEIDGRSVGALMSIEVIYDPRIKPP